MKRLLTREQYLDSIRTRNYSKFTGISTNEAFSNDVNWGDSWVGRLINSIRRKAKVAINLKRIDSLVKRLRSLFDEILESGKISVDSSTISFLTTLVYFDELADKINNEEKVNLIISHIDVMISQIKSYNLENRELFIKKLTKFRDFLSEMPVEDEKESDIESDGEEQIEVSSLFENLELLKELLVLFQTQKPSQGTEGEIGKGSGYEEKELVNPDIAVYQNDKGEVRPGIISKDQKVSPGQVKLEIPKFEAFAVSKKKIKNVVPFVKKGDKISFTQNGKKVSGEIIMIAANSDKISVKTTDGKTISVNMRNTDFIKESMILEQVDVKADSLMSKLKNAVSILVSSKDKGLSIDIKWIDQILSMKDDDQVQKMVVGLYKTIQAYIIGDKKGTLNPDRKPLIESFIDEYKLDMKNGYGVGKTQVAAEKLARFYFFCLKFTGDPMKLTSGDVGGYKLLGNIGSKLKELNNSTTSILKVKIGGSENKGEISDFKPGDKVSYDSQKFGKQTKEVIRVEDDVVILKGKDGEIKKNKSELNKVTELNRYSEFGRLNEAVDYGSIADKFDELFDDKMRDSFNINEETKEKLEKLIKAGDSIVLTNSDPIMEIVRLFNRAWRLHTPGRIPSGRIGGKVSMSVFQEYENLGDGGGSPDDPGNGPYRNIELYEKWQEAVLSILGDTKYRTTIFSDDAKFVFVSGEKLVSVQTIGREVDTSKSRPLGKILLRFINRLLADTQMYKKDGAMTKFIDEYFGISGDDVENLSYGKFNDVEKNREIAGGIKTPVLKFGKISDDLKELFKKRRVDGDGNDGIILRMKFDDIFHYFRVFDYGGTSNTTIYMQRFDSFPLERVQCEKVKIKVPESLSIVSYSNRKQLKTNTEFDFKQNKTNIMDSKNFDLEISTKRENPKLIEILKKDDEIFTDTSKYLFPSISKNLKKFEKDINNIKKQMKIS